jgi:hypothetical protein
LDTRRMSVLESIALEHLDDLDDRIDELCKEIECFDNDGEAERVIQEWKAAHRAVRNFVPMTPPGYADEVFDVYKEAVLDASYYFSISELLVDAWLAGIPLVTCVFDGDSFEYRGKSFAAEGNAQWVFLCLRDGGGSRQRGHFERMWPTQDFKRYLVAHAADDYAQRRAAATERLQRRAAAAAERLGIDPASYLQEALSEGEPGWKRSRTRNPCEGRRTSEG